MDYMNIKIGILVLNYNGLRHLEAFMPEAAFLRDRDDATLVIIDNASSDDSAEFMHEHYPWAVFVRNDSNYGWGEGYNRGVEALIKAGHQFTHYLFLNNDTEPSPDWYDKLRDAAKKAPQAVGEIGCRAVFKDKRISEGLFSAVSSAESSLKVSPVLPAHFDKSELGIHGADTRYSLATALSKSHPGKVFLGECGINNVAAWYALQIYNQSSEAISLDFGEGMVVHSESVNDRLDRWVISKGASGQRVASLGPDQKALVLRVLSAIEFKSLPPIVQNSGIGLNSSFEGYDMHLGDAWDAAQNQGDMRGICGVCKMVRAEVFHELGGFDPSYFMYYEDLDFSLRLTKLGFKRQIVPDAILVHAHAGTSDARSMFFTRQVTWSLYYFHWRHAGFLRRLRTWLAWKLRAVSEREMESNPMARPSEIALNKFAALVGKSYFKRPAEGQKHV